MRTRRAFWPLLSAHARACCAQSGTEAGGSEAGGAEEAHSARRPPVAAVLLVMLCCGGALGGALAYTEGARAEARSVAQGCCVHRAASSVRPFVC
jgi:hypothetical protein